MLQFFRKFLTSRFGAAIAIGVLVLIALAFGLGDVTSNGRFGGVTGGDRVATVGGKRIDTATLSQAASSALERVKQKDPTMSMKAFLANKGLDDTLDNLIDRLAIAVFGEENGIVASDRLIDSEIAKIPAFAGPDGKFSEDLYHQALKQQGINDKMLRDDLKQGLIARQVLMPASTGAMMPLSMAKRYAALLTETRKGEIAVLPSFAFAAKEKPTDAQVAAYYKKHLNDFIRPERRVIRYASFGDEILKDIPKPTDAEIALRYKANKAQYEPSERRRITQLIVPTEAAAKAVAQEVAGGTSLEAAAKSKGLEVDRRESYTREELTQQFSKEVADAVFAAAKGAIAKPARDPLGWHVVRVEDVERNPGKSLEQARDEIVKQLTEEKRRAALADRLEKIEDEFDSGSSLADVTGELGLKIETSKPLTADGKVYLGQGATAPDVLKPVIDTAFTMDVEQPQLAEIERGRKFLVYDVTDIAASAPAPLAEIKDDVKTAFIVDTASAAAKKAAEAVQAKIRKGASLHDALVSLKKPLPPIEIVSMSRPQLAQMQNQQGRVPGPLALMFNMAEGTTKVQPGPQKQAWFVIVLKDIEPGKVADNDPIITSAQSELGPVVGSEYTDALGHAIRKQVGVERNPDGIRAVREQLGGGS